MYINKSDIENQGISTQDIDGMNISDTAIDEAIKDAIEEASSYLNARYNLEQELIKTGSSRNRMLVKIIRDISIYNIYAQSNPVNMPEERVDIHNSAIKFLEKVRSERTNLRGLNRKLDNNGSSYLKFGSNKPRKNHY